MPAHDVEIHGTTSVFSTLTNIFVDENALLTVYNLKGMLVLKRCDHPRGQSEAFEGNIYHQR